MYALVQQQQQRRRQQQQQEQEEQQEQQPSPYWHPQPAVPPIIATPTFHNNSALAAHSPMARYQSSLHAHAHAHAEALNRHPWNAHPPAAPAPSLPLHRQPAPSPAIVRLLTCFPLHNVRLLSLFSESLASFPTSTSAPVHKASAGLAPASECPDSYPHLGSRRTIDSSTSYGRSEQDPT